MGEEMANFRRIKMSMAFLIKAIMALGNEWADKLVSAMGFG